MEARESHLASISFQVGRARLPLAIPWTKKVLSWWPAAEMQTMPFVGLVSLWIQIDSMLLTDGLEMELDRIRNSVESLTPTAPHDLR